VLLEQVLLKVTIAGEVGKQCETPDHCLIHKYHESGRNSSCREERNCVFKF